MFQIHELLKIHYGFDEFRPGQEDVVESIFTGRDTLALMPTGGGKSLCYQLTALALSGLTLVISPLIALMKDQVDGLKVRGIAADYINSSLSVGEISERLDRLRAGQTKLLYLAPERLANGFIETLKNIPISLIAVDEAHCVSAWGHDFRPDYLTIAENISKLPNRPVVAAFTATATPEVKEDIIKRLNLESPNVFARGFDRPNLRFFARANLRARDRDAEVLRLVNSMQGSGIVYCGTRDKTDELSAFLVSNGVEAEGYHAGMNAGERTRVQERFMQGEVRIIVATIAFGMGVDKPDVRFVIHAHLPGSLENYYQEAGRAGRDGELSYVILLASNKDVSTHQYFIRKNFEEALERGIGEAEAERVRNIKYRKLDRMKEYTETGLCRRKVILDYFKDEQSGDLNNCRGCDVCLNYQWISKVSGDNFVVPDESLSIAEDRKSGFDYKFYELLREWRKDAACQADVREFMILSNRTLKNIAASFPRNKEEFLRVPGIGERLYEKFGEQLEEIMFGYLGDDPVKVELEEKQDGGGLPDTAKLIRQFNLSETVEATVLLFNQAKEVSLIAKERNLSERAIHNHLISYYLAGGKVDTTKFVSRKDERVILWAMSECEDFTRLAAIKEKCLESVTYDQIRWVIARFKRIRL